MIKTIYNRIKDEGIITKVEVQITSENVKIYFYRDSLFTGFIISNDKLQTINDQDFLNNYIEPVILSLSGTKNEGITN